MAYRRVAKTSTQTAADVITEARRLSLLTSQRPASSTVAGAVLKFAQTFGNTTDKVYTLTHNLGTQDVIVHVFSLTDAAPVAALVEITSANAVRVSFDKAPGANAFRALVIG